MASRVPSGAGGTSGEDALNDAFQQMAQGLLRVQEALRVQEQQAERRAQEALRLQEQRAATALREAVQRLERERDDAVRALREQLQDRIRRVEDRMDRVEERLGASSWNGGSQEGGEGKCVEQLEGRMQKLEAAVQKAVTHVFPRVEALVAQLEKPMPLQESKNPLPKSSTCTSAPPLPQPSTSPSSSASPSPSSALGATGGAAAAAREEPLDEEQQKKRLERRIEEVFARRDRARAAPSSLGEELCNAAGNSRLEDVRRLIDAGADVNYTNSIGRSPLITALWLTQPSEAIVSLLLEKGAEVNAIDVYGYTALHLAAMADHSGRYVAQLIGAGADVDARNANGTTPLHFAAYNDEKNVRALLEGGARKNLRCWGGDWEWKNKTPYDLTSSDSIRNLLRP